MGILVGGALVSHKGIPVEGTLVSRAGIPVGGALVSHTGIPARGALVSQAGIPVRVSWSVTHEFLSGMQVYIFLPIRYYYVNCPQSWC